MSHASGEVAAILLAGGTGSRLDPTTNKVYLPIAGRDLLGYSLETLTLSPVVDRVIIVVRAADAERIVTHERYPSVDVTIGGATRHDSERSGLEAIAPDIEAGRIGLVAIHDGARPFASLDLLDRIVATAQNVGGAVPGLPMDEPTFDVGSGSARLVDRATLMRVQTPQAFRAAALLDAYRRAGHDGFKGVDTADTVERYSDLEIAVVPGDARNVKITYPEDIPAAEIHAANWTKGGWSDLD